MHRDAYRMDITITQQFSSRRPIFAVEIETMWICMGANDKYVYACIRALGQRKTDERVAEALQGLAEKHPLLYARLCDPMLNELYKPHFGREWFEKLKDQNVKSLRAERSRFGATDSVAPATSHLILQPGDSQTPDVQLQSAKSLDPSAPAFLPTSIG